jgi:uncharacterized protein (TIGR02231 family)
MSEIKKTYLYKINKQSIMKTQMLILFVFILASYNVTAEDTRLITAEIKHITVFPDRAQVNMETPVTIQPGKTTLKLSALSPYIDAQSLQVKGTGDFTILSVNQQNNYLKNLEESPEIRNIKNQITELQGKIEDEKTAMGILAEKEIFLTSNREILTKQTSFSIDQFRNVMELYMNNIEQVRVTSLMKQRLIKDYEKQVASLQKQLSVKMALLQLPTGEIAVTVTAEKAVQGRLYFSYVVSNAGWYPSYDIRVNDIKNPVTIIYKANVYQNTGIDWKDVRMSFSNATPWIAGNLPQLSTWFIDYEAPPAPFMVRGAQSMKFSAPVAMDSAVTMKEELAESIAAPPPVEKKNGETTVTFDVNVPCSVPTDGKQQTIEIQRLTTSAEYRYVTTPKLSQFAFLTANITDWASLSLQSGEATLYFENSFVGKSSVDVSQVTDTLALSLGNDNGIVVKREKRTDFTSRKSLGANKTETFSYLISIRNNKTVPVRLTLKDQIPISSNSGITVEALELSGGKVNGVTGEVRWDLDINKQETKQLILTYSVKYPRDKKVILD